MIEFYKTKVIVYILKCYNTVLTEFGVLRKNHFTVNRDNDLDALSSFTERGAWLLVTNSLKKPNLRCLKTSSSNKRSNTTSR